MARKNRAENRDNPAKGSVADTVIPAKVPAGFAISTAVFAVLLVALIVSCFDDSQTCSDVFVELSVLVLFIAGFFTSTRKLQLAYLLFANIYNIVFLAIFGKVFYDNFNQGIGILFLIQIIFLCVNLVPIVIHHLAHRDFFFMYQRQLIYPTLFFTFVLLSRLPGGETLIEQVSHEIFSLIIFTQSFDLLDSIHKIGKAYHLAAYQDGNDSSVPAIPAAEAPAVAAATATDATGDDDDDPDKPAALEA
ncbi:hypothetical protein [Bifidobacterium choloepi]|uniref:Uncharacterized protein n=1 Tax=Bifidobacterium choloepi TaxID=2614131 RepID=A0A6I5ND47_9BIFI|nr:hypothetical protein [Bifidobacterium choloepi]NEG70470.1 hypothetical protein [Bifidobacterium choloepi]